MLLSSLCCYIHDAKSAIQLILGCQDEFLELVHAKSRSTKNTFGTQVLAQLSLGSHLSLLQWGALCVVYSTAVVKMSSLLLASEPLERLCSMMVSF